MIFGDELIEEVRERNDVVDVISQYVSLKKKGSTYFGLCPFHNEKTGSFSVSRNKQMYYCFGCHKGGNVITFMMEYNRMSFPEAMHALADRVGIELPEEEQSSEQKTRSDQIMTLKEINKQAALYFHRLLKSKRGSNALTYLQNRGLSAETIIRFGLGYSDMYRDDLYRYLKEKGFTDEQLKDSSLVNIDSVKGSYDKFFNRVMFPIMDSNNRVIGFGGRVMGDGEPKYLNSKENILFEKGKNLYGINYARRSRADNIILCEGYMDVISLHQAGFDNAVAPLGTAFTAGQAALLKRCTKEVILSFDSDGAGINAALRALPILREAGLKGRVLNMKPYKDPDELIKACGAEEYQRRIDAAEGGRMFELLVLYQSYNQQDPESRMDCIHAMAKKLCAIEEPMERETYIIAAANRFMMNKEDLTDMVNRYGQTLSRQKVNDQYKPDTTTREEREKKKTDQSLKPQRLLLTWLYEEPQIYRHIKKYVGPGDFMSTIYHAVALMVFDALEKGAEINPARIMNQFMEVEEQNQVADIFNARLDYDPEDKDRGKILAELVKKVRLAALEDELAHTTDIMKWQDLLTEKSRIQNLKNINIDI